MKEIASALIVGIILAWVGAWAGYWFGRRQNKKALVDKQVLEEEAMEKQLLTEEDRYINFVINENEKLTFHGFEAAGSRVPVLLRDVYVPLRINITGRQERETVQMQVEAFQQDTSNLPVQEGENNPLTPFSKGEFQQDTRDLPVQEAVKIASAKKYDGLIILGDPGAGKTTLLKYFLLCFAKKEAAAKLNLPANLLPILLPLRSVDMKMTFIQAVLEQFKDVDLKLSEDFFLNRLRQGQAIVLLDGLDEVADEGMRKEMCRWIHKKVHSAFSKCPVIITSRFAGYRGEVELPGDYLELHIRDFCQEEIRRFLHSWYTAVETSLHEDSNYWRTQAQKAAEELYTRLESSEAYLKLAVNPLMLQLIALVHYDYKTIPDRRVDLYDKCLELLLQKWDEAKGLKTLLSAKEARQVLQPLALWMHSETGRRQVSKEDVLNQIQPYIQQICKEVNPEKFLAGIRDRSGVFVGFGTQTYGFQHHSFQEYLTAEQIRNKTSVEILVEHFDESWWREPTLLSLGLGNPSIFEPFMQKFMRSDKNNGASADFMLRCVREALVKSEAPLTECLKDAQLDWQARYNALLCLKEIGSDVAKEAVKLALEDKHPEIAGFAREVLIEWNLISTEEAMEVEPTTGIHLRVFNPLEDNAEYILISGGSYRMAETQKQVQVKSFYLAKFPVTNRLYRIFVRATNCREPEFWDDKRFNGDDQPVVGVRWDEAEAYCDWLTKNNKEGKVYRLPEEAEWEWAAGGGQREYPWGEEPPDKNRANYGKNVGYTTPVGNYPAGATPEGLMDMAGNVWEWTSDWYKPEDKDYGYVVKGGSWWNEVALCRCGARYDWHDFRFDLIGFRCCQEFSTLI